MNDLVYMSAVEQAELIRRRTLSPVELLGACLDRIEKRNPAVNAFVTLCAEEALEAARRAERAVMAGDPLGPLHGLPVAIKDLDPVAGVRMSRGSLLFADDVAPKSALFVTRLQQAGAIVIGKTNTPEFGHKAITDNFVFGPTSTPFNLAMNSGGSSGGSAAAVAEGLVPIAQGSDAGGSLRVPASLCGVLTLMPSFGRVPLTPRPNAFLLLNPMVCYGPLARSVEDGVLMLDVMSGHDPRDPYSYPVVESSLREGLNRPLRGLRVAFSPDLGGFPVEKEVATVVRAALTALVDDGAAVDQVEVTLPRPHSEITEMWRRFQAVRQAEFVAVSRRQGMDILGEHRDKLTPQYLDLLEMGASPSAVEYRMYDLLRSELFDAIQDVFDNYDLIVSPVTSVAGVPNTQGGNTVGPSEVAGEPVNPLVGWCLTGLYNFVGNPAASVPAGRTPGGLPVGLQIAGRRFDDLSVVAACAAVERHRPWHDDYLVLDRGR